MGISLVLLALLIASGGVLLRRHRARERNGQSLGAAYLLFAGLLLAFLVWLAIMVLLVGPSMRSM